MKNYLHRSLLFPLALVLSLGFVACEDDEPVDTDDLSGTTFSAEQNIGDGKAKLFVTRNAEGDPTEVGIRISESALTNLPDTMMMLGFDMISEGSETIFKHVTLDWNPHGHEPAMIFDVPHFDMHFYTMTPAELMTNISPSDPDWATKEANMPAAQYVPADYFVPPPVAAVPMMGVHWIDSTSGLMPGSFTEVMIYGSWDGKFHFVEPMMTTAWLATKPSIEKDLKLSQAYQTTGYWPTTYSVDFDDTTNEYVITLGGLTMRTAS